MTTIQLKFAGAVVVKESYTTVRNRLLDSRPFFEVNVNGVRKLFNKHEVQGVAFEEKAEKKK